MNFARSVMLELGSGADGHSIAGVDSVCRRSTLAKANLPVKTSTFRCSVTQIEAQSHFRVVTRTTLHTSTAKQRISMFLLVSLFSKPLSRQGAVIHAGVQDVDGTLVPVKRSQMLDRSDMGKKRCLL